MSVYYEHPWIQGFFNLLRKIRKNYSSIIILGICFGGQSLAQCFGGKVEKMSIGYHIRGSEPLSIDMSFYDLPYIKNLNIPKTGNFCVAEAHSDHISKLPDDAVLYA